MIIYTISLLLVRRGISTHDSCEHPTEIIDIPKTNQFCDFPNGVSSTEQQVFSFVNSYIMLILHRCEPTDLLPAMGSIDLKLNKLISITVFGQLFS